MCPERSVASSGRRGGLMARSGLLVCWLGRRAKREDLCSEVHLEQVQVKHPEQFTGPRATVRKCFFPMWCRGQKWHICPICHHSAGLSHQLLLSALQRLGCLCSAAGCGLGRGTGKLFGLGGSQTLSPNASVMCEESLCTRGQKQNRSV